MPGHRTRPPGLTPSRRAASAGLAIAALLMATGAKAQQREFYDSSGRVSGREATDSRGNTTLYDASGHVAARTSTSGNQTTIYGADGRRIGTERQDRR